MIFFCLGVYFVIIMIIHAGDDPRGGGHVRHVQDPALGRQTESEHLGRDREVRVVWQGQTFEVAISHFPG